MFFGEEIQICFFYLIKTKSFNLKKISICFWEFRKNGFWFVKDQICFVILKKKKKNQICVFKKIRFVFICVKKWKRFLEKRISSWNKFMLCVLNKTNKTIHDPFLFQNLLCKKKKRSTSNENVDQFLIWKKCRSASNEDANRFLTWGKFESTSKEDADPFLI